MRSFLGRTRRTAPRSVLHGIGSLIQSSDVPSLDLNFLSGYLDPRIDFQRTTTGTYYRGPFNQNLVTYSQQFSVSLPWGTNSGGGGSASSPVVATTTEPAPDGTLTAFRVTFNKTGGTFSRLEHPLSVGVIGQTYTMSVWMKANTANGAAATQNVGIRIGNDPSGYNCVVTTSWQRFSYSYTVAATATNAQIMLWDSIVGNDETADVFIWGAQLTEGSLLTPYIPTTTAAITQGQIAAAEPWNLLLRSQEFDLTATWTNSISGTGVNPARTANNAVAPDGTTTADTVVFDSGAGTTSTNWSSMVQSNVAVTATQTYTFSVWLRGTVGGEKLVVRHVAGSSYSLLTLTTQWQRFTVTEVAFSGTGSVDIGVRQSISGHGIINANPTVEMWGAQLNLGSAPLAYRSTTTAALWLPRFENDPITGEARGLLVEGGTTNVCLQSAAVRTSPWNVLQLTAAGSSITAPDGTASGTEVVINNGITSGNGYIYQDITASASTTYTASVYIKIKGTTQNTRIECDALTSANANIGTFGVTFTHSSETIGSVSAVGWTAQSGTLINVGNGWYRVIITATTPATTAKIRWFMYSTSTGNGTDGRYLWGAQMEAQALASSYIPTTTATVARGTDSALMTGTNFSSWFNQAEGTIYAETLVTSTSGGGQLAASMYQNSSTYLDIGQGTATSAPDTTRFYIRTGGVDEAVLNRTLSPLTLYESARMAGAYRTNDAAYTLNGLSVVTDATVTLPSAPIELRLGQQQAATTSSRLIRRLAYWPTRLPNATLQALTT
jgi:hypothetical protein